MQQNGSGGGGSKGTVILRVVVSRDVAATAHRRFLDFNGEVGRSVRLAASLSDSQPAAWSRVSGPSPCMQLRDASIVQAPRDANRPRWMMRGGMGVIWGACSELSTFRPAALHGPLPSSRLVLSLINPVTFIHHLLFAFHHIHTCTPLPW